MVDLNASTEEVVASRRLLGNPYAHLNDLGGFDGIRPPESVIAVASAQEARSPGGWNFQEIESNARDLQREIWRNRGRLFPHGVPDDPVHLLEPSVAIEYMGYDFGMEEFLGEYYSPSARSDIAGIIDRSSRIVRISRRFESPAVRRFTAAHELGHIRLDHQGIVMHRDRPRDGCIPESGANSRIEIEANKFATCFLMPRKLVRVRFAANFGTESPLVLSDETAFMLEPKDPFALLKSCRSVREFARVLAAAGSYGGRHIMPLAVQFNVSVETMAIRIEELGLAEVRR